MVYIVISPKSTLNDKVLLEIFIRHNSKKVLCMCHDNCCTSWEVFKSHSWRCHRSLKVYSNHIRSNGVRKCPSLHSFSFWLSSPKYIADFFFWRWSAAAQSARVQKKQPPIGGVQPLLHMGKCAEIRRTNIFCGLNLKGAHAAINKLTSSLQMPHEQARAEPMGEHLDVWKKILCLLPKYMLSIYYLMMCIDRNRG